MAISSGFQTKSNVNVYIGTEVTMGTATIPAGTWHSVPVIDYSVSDIQASLGVAPQRTNSFGQQESGAVHDRTGQTYEISLTMHGTAGVLNRLCGAMYEDSDGTNALLGSSPTTTTFKDGVGNTVPVTILFENGGATAADLQYVSCMLSSMELSYGVGSDGGALKTTATFVTGYEPTDSAIDTPVSPVATEGTMFNIFDLSTHTLGGEDLLLHDFSLSISRPVNRISWNAADNYKPHGYSIGGYEVTGSLSCKRDIESQAVPTNTSAGIVLALSDGTFQIDAPDCMVESVSTDLADEGWKKSFTYRCFYNDASETNPIVTITTA